MVVNGEVVTFSILKNISDPHSNQKMVKSKSVKFVIRFESENLKGHDSKEGETGNDNV